MRIKRGTSKNQKHKKVLKQAKGYRMTYSKLYRRAMEAVRHAGNYNFAHRRRRKSQKRQEWISTISAALSNSGITYSRFVSAMKNKKIDIDRKNLAIMAVKNPAHFDALVKEIQ